MSEKKQCVNCNRGIDVAAKSCLFCNWWQAEKPAAPVEASAPAHPQNHMNRNVLGAVAFVALLIIAFVIGSLIHGFEPSEVKAAQQPKAPSVAVDTQAPAPPTANIPLVPDNSAPPGPLDQTTANSPMTTTVSGAMGGDATAMTSEQYGAAQQAVPPRQQAQTIDPRSVTGTVYGQTQPTQPRVPRPQRRPTTSRMTQPVPEYQPVPSLRGHGHARLTLTVDADGRVRDVDIVQPLAGDMGRLIGAVQSWRFRPATDNGVPVTSRFTVDISVE
jgi:TonB family protein